MFKISRSTESKFWKCHYRSHHVSSENIAQHLSSATNLLFLHQTLCNAHRCVRQSKVAAKTRNFSVAWMIYTVQSASWLMCRKPGTLQTGCLKCTLTLCLGPNNKLNAVHRACRILLSTTSTAKLQGALSPAVQLLIAGAGSMHQELGGDRPTTATSNSSCRLG